MLDPERLARVGAYLAVIAIGIVICLDAAGAI